MKLFVDDQRECPPGWQLARTIDKAIRILAEQEVSEVSLDHDIAIKCTIKDHCFHASGETYQAVARFIASHFPAYYFPGDIDAEHRRDLKIRLHTASPDGAKAMAKILDLPLSIWEPYNPKNYL